MRELKHLAETLLIRSKSLTLSCLFSLTFALFSIMLMVNFAVNSLMMEGVGTKEAQSLILIVAILAAMVLCVSSLFTAAVFGSYLRKYHTDMAVLRVLGGGQQQVRGILERQIHILLIISFAISLPGCWCFYQWGLPRLTSLARLSDYGALRFHVIWSLAAGIFICLLIRAVLLSLVVKQGKMLPVDVIRGQKIGQNESGRRKAHSFRFDNDFTFSMQLLAPKIRETRLIIATIAILTVMIIFGSSMFQMLSDNGIEYLKRVYISDLVAMETEDSSGLNEQSVDRIEQELKSCSQFETAVMFMANEITIKDGGEREEVFYQRGDLNALFDQGLISHDITGSGVLVSSNFAKEHNLKTGDNLTVEAGGHEKELLIQEIFPAQNRYWADILVDKDNPNLVPPGPDFLDTLYISGDTAAAEEKLSELKEQFPELTWSTLNQRLDYEKQLGRERGGLFFMTVWCLVVIAGIGWINSLSSMIKSREADYNMLHVLGFVPLRVVKIMVYQIACYLFAGVLIGAVLGAGFLALMHIGFCSMIMLLPAIVFMVLLCLLLIPEIRRIAWGKRLLCVMKENEG